MTDKVKRHLIDRFETGHVFFVQFKKSDGTHRSMRMQWNGGRLLKKNDITKILVDDLELGEPRWVTVDSIKVLTEARSVDDEGVRYDQTFEHIKSLTDSFFGT